MLGALDHLQSKGIAHRDLRSDNLLVNRDGVVKLADFTSAVQVARINPIVSDQAGVIYWQAPEMRKYVQSVSSAVGAVANYVVAQGIVPRAQGRRLVIGSDGVGDGGGRASV